MAVSTTASKYWSETRPARSVPGDSSVPWLARVGQTVGPNLIELSMFIGYICQSVAVPFEGYVKREH